MIVLGIVGSPAGGKSTVARHLQELGATWINADEIARTVLEQDDIQQQLLAYFGSQIADSGGRIDRSRLAARVFGDDDSKRVALNYLEGVVHPETRRIIADRLSQAERSGAAVAVLDVPLLFESGWDLVCDAIWCIDADRDGRLQRAKSRGWDDHQLRSREDSQVGIETKKRLSTQVFMNDGTLEQLFETIDKHWRSFDRHIPTNASESHCFRQDA